MNPDLLRAQTAAKRLKGIISGKSEATVLYAERKYKQALEQYQHVLTMQPAVDTRSKLHFNTALCMLAMLEAASGPPKEVLTALKAALADNPNYFKVRVTLLCFFAFAMLTIALAGTGSPEVR